MSQCLRVDFGKLILDIHLFDDVTVDKWFRFYRARTEQGYRYQAAHRKSNHEHNLFDLDALLQRADLQWQKIRSCVDQLRGLGMRVPFELDPIFDFQQSTLNYLHRFFTYNSMWHEHWSKDHTPNPFDPDWQLPAQFRDYQVWHDFIDQINCAVHSLETCCRPLANTVYVNTDHPLKFWQFMAKDNATRDIKNNWLAFDGQDQQGNYSYLKDDRHLVILDISICGKPLLQSFMEHDDPRAKDCTGRLGSFGGFIVDIDHNRRNLYRSERFQSWLAYHNINVDQAALEYPIGWVDDIVPWQQLYQNPRQTSLNVSFLEN